LFLVLLPLLFYELQLIGRPLVVGGFSGCLLWLALAVFLGCCGSWVLLSRLLLLLPLLLLLLLLRLAVLLLLSPSIRLLLLLMYTCRRCCHIAGLERAAWVQHLGVRLV
jgi:hypothetical protein